MEAFNEWLEDNTIKTGEDIYITQCTQYSKEFSLEELKAYFKKEYTF